MYSIPSCRNSNKKALSVSAWFSPSPFLSKLVMKVMDILMMSRELTENVASNRLSKKAKLTDQLQ